MFYLLEHRMSDAFEMAPPRLFTDPELAVESIRRTYDHSVTVEVRVKPTANRPGVVTLAHSSDLFIILPLLLHDTADQL